MLSGQRIKARKRDEKEKYNPNAFRDAIVQGLNEAGKDIDQITKFLDAAGGKLNYRRYAEALFDILFAGGILAPGGSIVEDGDPGKPFKTDICIFACEEDYQSIKAQYEIFYKLIRRYKYLEKSFEEEQKKLIVFLKGFDEEQRRKLATVMGVCMAAGMGNASCLGILFEDHLVKDGLSLTFATDLFKAWLTEKDINAVATVLKRAGLEGKLMNLLPVNKRNLANFEAHFREAGLQPICDYQRAKQTMEVKRELQKQMEDMIQDEDPTKDVIIVVKESMAKNCITEPEVAVMAWHVLMASVEWNKKEELVAEQALKHLKTNALLLEALTTTDRSELQLLLKIQEYCYENQSFLKVFQKIVILLYKADVLSEETILKWHNGAHSSKGKSVFLDQTKKFVEWLQHAEEEESGEEEDEEEEDEKEEKE